MRGVVHLVPTVKTVGYDKIVFLILYLRGRAS